MQEENSTGVGTLTTTSSSYKLRLHGSGELSDLRVLAKAEGEALWFLDTLMQVKLSPDQTETNVSVFEQTAPPGSATPMHRHDQTDELFYVLDGEVVFHTESTSKRCASGSFVAVPRGVTHAFRVTESAPARLLVISAPGHFEQFVRSVARPATELTLPPVAPPPGPEAIAKLAEVGAQHDTVLVGPPPAP
jgi:quercetin dioxygenase-like cupin family protein